MAKVQVNPFTGELDLVGTGAGGTGITQAQHEALDTLVHNISEDTFDEIIRDVNGKLVGVIQWTDGTKTTKVREYVVNTRGNRFINKITTIQYDAAGSEIVRLEQTINRTGSRIDSVVGDEIP